MKIQMKSANLKNSLILITRKLPEKIEKKLEENYSVIQNKKDKKYSYKDLKKRIENIDILIPCISDTIDASIIKAAKKLKLIANFGNGVDNLDLITAKEKKIVVTNTPDVLTEDTADVVLTMLLMLFRKILTARKKLLKGEWNGGAKARGGLGVTFLVLRIPKQGRSLPSLLKKEFSVVAS